MFFGSFGLFGIGSLVLWELVFWFCGNWFFGFVEIAFSKNPGKLVFLGCLGFLVLAVFGGNCFFVFYIWKFLEMFRFCSCSISCLCGKPPPKTQRVSSPPEPEIQSRTSNRNEYPFRVGSCTYYGVEYFGDTFRGPRLWEMSKARTRT